MAASPWPGWLPLTAGLLLLVGTASALQGVQAEQADFPGLQQPSASECRAHIEAALKELSTTKTEEGASGSAEGSEEVPGGSTQSDEITSQEGEQTAPDESIEQESREASEGKDVDLSEEAASTASQEEPPISGESEEISEATADSKELPAGSDEDASGDNISNEQEGRDSDEAGGSSRTSDEDQKTSAGSAEDESTEIPGTSAEDGESRQVDSVEDGESREEPTASDEEGAASVEGESKEETQVSTEGSVEAPEASTEDSQAEASDEGKSREARDVSGDGSQEATAASAEDSDSQETEEASGEEGESREPPAESADGSESREAPAESAEDGESREFPAGSAEEGESGEAPAQSAEGSESGEALAESTEGSESKETPAESGEEGESREAPVESAEDGDSKETPTESAEGESKEAEVSGEGDSKEATEVSDEEGESRETREVSVEEGASKEASGEDGESKEVQQVSGEEGESREGSGEEGESKEASGVDGDSKEASGEGERTEAPVSGEEGESAEATPASGEGESQEAPEVSGEGESKEGPPASEEEGASQEDVTHEEKSAEESDETLVPAESKESVEKMAGESVEDTDKESTEQGSKERIVPEEDLAQEIPIPSDRRPRSHISEILQLQELAENDLIIQKMIDSTLKDLKKIYDNAIKPLEVLYKYRDLSNRHYGDPEIFSKPLILFMGPWSGGKSTIINYLMDLEFTKLALRTGAEPSPAYFNILMWGEREEVLDGTQLAADWTFSGLQKFGQGLLDRLRGLHLPNRLLEKVNIVEIPGILEIRKQVERLFPFNDACQWFIDRADIIFLVYDPSKLDVGPETEAILDQLKGRESQVRIILNKADQVKPEELMRVQGTLIWNISPLMSSSEPPVMYSTSLWSVPYEIGAPIRLLNAQEQAFLKDIRKAIDKRVDNKIASARRFAVRVRNHAKMVDCYLTTYYNHKTFFGNKKKITEDIIEHPQNYHIYEGLSTLTNISRYDLPDPEIYRDFFKLNPLYDFQQLSATCTYFRGCPINQLDIAIAYELPELVGKYKKSVEEALAHMAASRKS